MIFCNLSNLSYSECGELNGHVSDEGDGLSALDSFFDYNQSIIARSYLGPPVYSHIVIQDRIMWKKSPPTIHTPIITLIIS